MGDDQDDTLVGYYFGALEPEDAAEIEQRLRDDPEFARRFERLRECFAASEESGEPAPAADSPPNDLADRTCHRILARAGDATDCVGKKRFSLLEVGVVGVAALLLGSMFLPALEASRERSRRITCQNNLAEIYRALDGYSGDHKDRFPEIGLGQNAGLFAVALADGSYLNRDDLQQRLVCPSSQLADQVSQRRVSIVVPTRTGLELAPILVRARLQRVMAGSFAYRIGYFRGDDYVYPRNRTDCRAALLADAPVRDWQGKLVGNHHGECGQNVLFEDGHVAFQSCWSPVTEDHLFLNANQEVAAGRGPNDIVLAPSEATPGAIRFVRLGL